MIAELNPYPAMKDSVVPWLGAVPEHWEVLPNRALFREAKERGHPEAQLLSVTIKKGVVRQQELLADSSKKDGSNQDKSAYKLVQRGDIAYNKMRAWQGAVGASAYRGIVSPAYVVQRPRPAIHSSYAHYLMRTPAFAKEAERWSYGITSDMWSLRPEHFKMIYGCVPPLNEQTAIVRFLNHADRCVSNYILAKQKWIKLLEEQKQAIIHRAITRGIDPNVRLKPSGVAWLEDVPQDWTLKRFKFLAHINSGQVDPRTPEYREKILVAPNHIRSGSGQLTSIETAAEQGADSGKYEVRKGQIIYSKIRPNLRKAVIAPFDCLCSADMYPITVREDELRTQYLLLVLLSTPFTKFAVDCSMRVAMPKINREALKECWLWYPTLGEQDQILRFVSRAAEPFNAAVDRARREISLIHEHRTRVIADVITGKVDVREVAARLPIEAEELESLDEAALQVDDDKAIERADLDTESEEAEA